MSATETNQPLLARLAHLIARRRKIVVVAWAILTLFGAAVSAPHVSKRWFQSFSIPGFSAYEANQRTLKTFGSGEQPPLLAVFSTPNGDITTLRGIQPAIDAGAAIMPKARVGSWFATHSDGYVSRDRHTMFATIYPPGNATFSKAPPIKRVRAAILGAVPQGVSAHLTGSAAIIESQGQASG